MIQSIKDVAEAAGVSTATVSRVLSGRGYVSDVARQKVETAVKKLNYRPNRVARSLREQKSRVIGLIISDIRNPFFSEITKAVEDAALAHSFSVLICNTNEDPTREANAIHLMIDEHVAGILISPTLTGGKSLTSFIKPGFPVVVFDRKPAELSVDSVLIDNMDSALRLTESLISSGHRRIAGIFGEKSFTANERLKGFRAALSKTNLEPAGIYKVDPVERTGERIAENILALEPPVDAVVCSSALLAIGAYKTVHHSKRKLGFACFDDAVWTSFVNHPPVTVIRQPTEQIGTNATELLLKRIADPTRAVSEVILKGELIAR